VFFNNRVKPVVSRNNMKATKHIQLITAEMSNILFITEVPS